MKFSSGVIVGAALGGYLMYSMSPDQRERVAATASDSVQRLRSSSVGRSVADNVGDVAGAASDRVADKVDEAGAAATDAVSSDSTGSPSTT